jgi:FlaA1/EpsC-like NDP-sugar epimerase
LINKLLSLSRFNKQLFFLIIDLIVLFIVLLFAFSIRLGYWYWPDKDLLWLMMLSPVISIPFFIRFGLYRSVIRYIGFDAIWKIVQAVSLYALVWGIFTFMIALEGIPRSVILINWFISIFAISGIRLFVRWFLNSLQTSKKTNVVIYGSGMAGRQLSIALNASNDYNPVAFIDDDEEIQGSFIAGIPVIPPKELEGIIQRKNITEVLLAIPSISGIQRAKIIKFLEFYPVHVRSLPGFSELVKGKIQIADLREVSTKDLLGRISVSPNKSLLGLNINNKVVLVTGAGGSIGSELCKQIFFLNPKVLILFEQSELALYSIEKELAKIKSSNIKIVPLLGSINDKERLRFTLEFFCVETIYHAAAYKHVPMVEFNNAEGVKNNILGTLCCAQLAIEQSVETFVFISTDKAVRPTNTMGATKRFSEMILQALTVNQSLYKSELDHMIHNKSSKFFDDITTKFSIVRFGNVLGSSGSVIPLFKEQIKLGGPVTVTSPKISRYFMSITEAVELVIQAGAMSKGGEVFVLDMGEPVLILDLAKKMIRLSGLEVRDKKNPNGDIDIKFSGLRPGEKLYEELLIGKNVSSTDNPKIMMALEEMLSWADLKLIINELVEAIDNFDHAKIRELLIKAVPEFKPQSDIVDMLYKVK